MSEQELKDGLRLAVADEPPMGFDVDELVSTAERMVRRRRALVTVGVSATAVAVAAVSVPVLLGIGGGPQEIPVATAPPSSAQPPQQAQPTQKPPSRTVDQLRQRDQEMRTYLLNGAFAQVVPGVRSIEVRPFGGEAEGQVWEGQSYLEGTVAFDLGVVRSAIAVQVRADQQDEKCATGCQELPQQDGSKVYLQREDVPAGNDPEMKIVSATHLRKDGTLTRVSTYNYNPVGRDKPVFQPDVALSTSQLVRLATDPALHL